MLCPILTSAASALGAATANPAAAISANPTAATAFLPCMLPLLTISKCDAFAFGPQKIGSCQARLASASAPRALGDGEGMCFAPAKMVHAPDQPEPETAGRRGGGHGETGHV